MSFYYCVEYFTESWFDWTYIIFILSIIPFLWEVVKTVGNKYRYRFPFACSHSFFLLFYLQCLRQVFMLWGRLVGEGYSTLYFLIIFSNYIEFILCIGMDLSAFRRVDESNESCIAKKRN